MIVEEIVLKDGQKVVVVTNQTKEAKSWNWDIYDFSMISG